MRVIRRIGYAALLLVLLGMPAQAQDSTPTPCDIDLSEAAALLTQAQAQASSGNTETALATLADVQARLDAIRSACRGGQDGERQAETTPATEAPAATPTSRLPAESVEITPPKGYQAYQSPRGDFAFAYPADWTYFTEGTTVFTGVNEQVAQAITSADGTLSAGQQGAAVVVGQPGELLTSASEGATPAEIAEAYRATLTDIGFEAGDVTETSVGDQPGVRLTFSTPGFDGLLLAFQLSDSQLGLVLGTAAPGERDDLSPIAQTIAESIKLNTRE